MKTLILVLAMCAIVFGQVSVGDFVVTKVDSVTIGGVTKSAYKFIQFRPNGRFAILDTWVWNADACETAGNHTIWIRPDTVGSTSTEMDSLYTEIQVVDEDGNVAYRPLVYADYDDAIPEFQETARYLDYTDRQWYSCSLGGVYSVIFGYRLKIGHTVETANDSVKVILKFMRN